MRRRRTRAIVIRGIIWLIIAFEALVVADVIPVPGHTLTWFWILYVIAGCLVFYELPLALARDDPEARRQVMVVGALVINALLFDLLGQLLDLWEVPIVGRLTYDNLVHATSLPFAICALIWAVAMRTEKAYQLERVRYFVPAFVAMGALSLSAVHELIEFAIDLATGSNAGTSIVPGDLYDTHLDLAYDAFGIALFVAVLVVLRHGTRRTAPA